MNLDARTDRLYELLPAIYRIRDNEQGEPLKALLQVIAEQVNLLEDDITQLYENWFIETAQDWVVPYIAELIGYQPAAEAGDPNVGSPERNRILIPKRDVANTIRARRRKGTLALLEELARDVAGWPARAVEFYRLLSYFQSLNFVRLDRGKTTDVHDPEILERIDGPFDELAHTIDVRRIQSPYQQGKYNIPSVGLFIWRLKVYSVTKTPAYCLETVSPNAYTFSILGNDTPLFNKPKPEGDPTQIAQMLNLPVPIKREVLEKNLKTSEQTYYGEKHSFQIWKGVKEGSNVNCEPICVDDIKVADLTDWKAYQPQKNTVAVDPLLGRILFPANQLPTGVWVSYHYGFSDDMGGGEYNRQLQPLVEDKDFYCQISKKEPENLSSDTKCAESIEEALEEWEKERAQKPRAILEITDSEVYAEQLTINLCKDEHLIIRAANHTRPIIYLLDYVRNKPDALTITSESEKDEHQEASSKSGGCITLDGLLIAGRAVHIEGPLQGVRIHHCTLVPGWDLYPSCEPKRPIEPSLELYNTKAKVNITHSILGSIQVYQDEVKTDPISITLSDSILDATDLAKEALGGISTTFAHSLLTFKRCTVFGEIKTHAIELAEDSIFMSNVRVARRQIGCIRFCYVPPESRTPSRYRCQPDLVEVPIRNQANGKALSAEQQKEVLNERLRVRPQFNSTRYGQPTYGQLALACAGEIKRGAEDESEMGAFHNLFEPQKLANLQARLNEYSPARADISVILADLGGII